MANALAGFGRVTAMALPEAVIRGAGKLAGLSIGISILSATGVQDWIKQQMLKGYNALGDVLSGEGEIDFTSFFEGIDSDSPAGKNLKELYQSEIEGFRAASKDDQDQALEFLREVKAGVHDDMFQETFDAIAAEIASNDYSTLIDVFMDAASPWMETFSTAAADIARSTHTPQQLRDLAESYRAEAEEIVVGANMAKMLDDNNLRVAEQNPETQEFQAALDDRFTNGMRNVDQTMLTGSLDDVGMEYVGNLTVRLISGGLAALLDAKADGRLKAEVKNMEEIDEWYNENAGLLVEDYLKKSDLQEAFGAMNVGRQRNWVDPEQYTYESLMEGYMEGIRMRSIRDDIDENDLLVAEMYRLMNVMNLFSQYQTLMFDNVPGANLDSPGPPDRARMYKGARDFFRLPSAGPAEEVPLAPSILPVEPEPEAPQQPILDAVPPEATALGDVKLTDLPAFDEVLEDISDIGEALT